MANHCFNSINIYGKPESIEKVKRFFEDYENHDYINDWVHAHVKDNRLDVDADPFQKPYGGRWFDFDINDDGSGEYLHVSGSSAWSPMLGMCKVLSDEFNLEIDISFEESGCDFGGQFIFKDGSITKEFDGSYAGYRFWEDGIDFIVNELEYYDSEEDIREWIDYNLPQIKKEANPTESQLKEIEEFVQERIAELKEEV